METQEERNLTQYKKLRPTGMMDENNTIRVSKDQGMGAEIHQGNCFSTLKTTRQCQKYGLARQHSETVFFQ